MSDSASVSLAASGIVRSPASHCRMVRSLAWHRRAASACVMQADSIRSRNSSGEIGRRSHPSRTGRASEMVNAGVDLYTVGRVLGQQAASAEPQAIDHASHEDCVCINR